MNWLAHVFLSENHIENQLANILADPLKGKAWEGATLRFKKGLKNHQLIDSFTDSHPMVKQSKSRFKGKKYLKGVVVDILYDYFLTIHWHLYCKIEIEPFITKLHSQGAKEAKKYPLLAKEKILRVIEINLLLSYNTLEGLEIGFGRIDKRLSQRLKAKETASSYMPLIKEELEGLEQDFLLFFPELMAYMYQNIDINYLTHWQEINNEG